MKGAHRFSEKSEGHSEALGLVRLDGRRHGWDNISMARTSRALLLAHRCRIHVFAARVPEAIRAFRGDRGKRRPCAGPLTPVGGGAPRDIRGCADNPGSFYLPSGVHPERRDGGRLFQDAHAKRILAHTEWRRARGAVLFHLLVLLHGRTRTLEFRPVVPEKIEIKVGFHHKDAKSTKIHTDKSLPDFCVFVSSW